MIGVTQTTCVESEGQQDSTESEPTIDSLCSTLFYFPYRAHLQKYSETFIPSGDHYRQSIRAQLAAPIYAKGQRWESVVIFSASRHAGGSRPHSTWSKRSKSLQAGNVAVKRCALTKLDVMQVLYKRWREGGKA